MSSGSLRSLIAIIALLILALSGCGGGGGDESASQSVTQISSETEQAKQEGKPEGASRQGKEETRSTSKPSPRTSKPSPHHIPVTVPPISSATVEGSKAPAPGVKTAKGGDNSVQGYGVESSESAREEAALALQAYLDARVEEDWGRACSYLGQPPTEQLEEQIAQPQFQGQGSDGAKPPRSCAGAMADLSKDLSPSTLREGAKITEVLSFRVEGNVPGDPSFLLYLGLPGQTLYSMPMYLERGGWKVGLVLPSALPV